MITAHGTFVLRQGPHVASDNPFERLDFVRRFAIGKEQSAGGAKPDAAGMVGQNRFHTMNHG